MSLSAFSHKVGVESLLRSLCSKSAYIINALLAVLVILGKLL